MRPHKIEQEVRNVGSIIPYGLIVVGFGILFAGYAIGAAMLIIGYALVFANWSREP